MMFSKREVNKKFFMKVELRSSRKIAQKQEDRLKYLRNIGMQIMQILCLFSKLLDGKCVLLNCILEISKL